MGGGGGSVWETRAQERKGRGYRRVFSMKEWALSTLTSLLSHLLGVESLRFGGKLSPTALVPGLGGSLYSSPHTLPIDPLQLLASIHLQMLTSPSLYLQC